jgi:hypothetical protein
MAIIPQKTLFGWKEDIETLGDLERLKLVIETLPDERLMIALEKERGNGRDDFPDRAMFNSILAGTIFGHSTIESLIREMNRNVQLRYVCGFARKKIPKAYNYTRFLKKLLKHQNQIDEIFQALVRELQELLPDFGQRLAIDSKNISSFAKRANKNPQPDGRRELDADIGIKTYKGVHKNGTLWEKTVKCFGYKLHLIVDATYELPIAYEVTKASAADITKGMELLAKAKRQTPQLIHTCQYFTGDKGYDATDLIEWLADKGIHPVIDKRRMWQTEAERLLFEDRENLYYNEQGEVYCYEPSGGRHLMTNNGYEKERNCLRKSCPAKAMGADCKSTAQCSLRAGIRIPLGRDKRIFTSIDRSSYKWEREYKHRTAVERVNSRLDVSFGFENHTIRGKPKMQLRCCLALIIMLTLAVGRIRQEHPELMRSLVKTA